MKIRTRFTLTAIVPVKLAAALLHQRQPITINDDMMGADIPKVTIIGDTVEQLRREPVGREIEPRFHIRVHAPQSLLQRSGIAAEIDKFHNRGMAWVAALLRRLAIIADAEADRQDFGFAHGACDRLKERAFIHRTGKIDVMGDG